MELTRRRSLFELLVEGFRIAFRSIGQLLGVLVISGLGAGIYFAGAFFFQMTAVPLGSLALLAIGGIVLFLFQLFFQSFITVLTIRIFGSKAEKLDNGFGESFSNSFLPSIYHLLFMILLYICVAALAFAAALLLRQFGMVAPSPSMLTGLGIVGAIIFVYILIRLLLFVPFAIALRGQGPIEACSYAWDLSRGNFGKLFCALVLGLLPLVIYGVLVAVLVAVVVPLTMSGMNTHSFVFMIFPFILGVIAWGLGAASGAYFTLLFIDMDKPEVVGSNTISEEQLLSTQTLNGADLVQIQQAEKPKIEVEVFQSTLHSSEMEEDLTEEHLDQVYQPKPEENIKVMEEEDRMPTILFDDEMAKQIELERTKWEQMPQNKSHKDDDSDSTIKMSK